METLGKLFNSTARVKIMRLFLLNPNTVFNTKSISSRSKVAMGTLRKELSLLISAKFIKRKALSKKNPPAKRRSGKKKKAASSGAGFVLDQNFSYGDSLRELLIDAAFIKHETLAKNFKKAGRVKLLIVAGVFTHDPESRLDLLVVGDNLKRRAVDSYIKNLEAEIGKELSYAMFETSDFLYRRDMYDKLVCDVLDFPHEKVINAVGVANKVRE